jgi:hypothetical protein
LQTPIALPNPAAEVHSEDYRPLENLTQDNPTVEQSLAAWHATANELGTQVALRLIESGAERLIQSARHEATR